MNQVPIKTFLGLGEIDGHKGVDFDINIDVFFLDESSWESQNIIVLLGQLQDFIGETEYLEDRFLMTLKNRSMVPSSFIYLFFK